MLGWRALFLRSFAAYLRRLLRDLRGAALMGFVTGLATLFSVGCAPGLEGDPAAYRTYGLDGGLCDPAAFVADRCGDSICHDADNPASERDLVSPDAGSRLLGATSSCDGLPLVEVDESGAPMNVGESYFLEKVQTLRPRCGSTMPLGGGHLSAAEAACLEQFVRGL